VPASESSPISTFVNLAVLKGALSTVPEIRELPSGERVLNLAVRTTANDGRATSVPVAWWNPPAWVVGLDAGDEVVVVGSVRRRFFRTATGARGARAEVEAASVARATARRCEAARRRADGRLAALM
jgi:single-strand DNA-binding protein